MKLRLGFMKSEQLAQWFGVSYSNYRKNVQKKLELLGLHCEYEKVWGGVRIKKIYEENFNSNLTPYIKIYLDEIMSTDEGLSTFAGMTRKRKMENKEALKEIKQSTEYSRIRMAGNKAFGQIRKGDKQAKGPFGTKKYVWAIQLDRYNNYRSLTYEEWKLYINCTKKVCDENPERIVQGMLLNQAYKTGEMTKEEFLECQEQYKTNLFPDIKAMFQEKTGFRIVCVQQHMVDDGVKNKFYNKIVS